MKLYFKDGDAEDLLSSATRITNHRKKINAVSSKMIELKILMARREAELNVINKSVRDMIRKK